MSNKQLVLIVIGTRRLDVVSCYQDVGIKTPNIDALAAEVRRATTLIAFCRKRLLKAESDVKKITGECSG